MTDLSTISAVIVNYNTADLTIRSAQSFHRWYPAIPMLIFDNNSSKDQQHDLRRELHSSSIVFNQKNLYHGPAMHQALLMTQSPKVVFLDSDCVAVHGGFIERMAATFEDPQTYAAGHLVLMNKRGFQVSSPEGGIPYIRPYCMMIRRAMYMTLPPFRHHGAPCLENMEVAQRRGYRLADLPLGEYVKHEGRGTVNRFGYQLGVKGKINHLLNKFGL